LHPAKKLLFKERELSCRERQFFSAIEETFALREGSFSLQEPIFPLKKASPSLEEGSLSLLEETFVRDEESVAPRTKCSSPDAGVAIVLKLKSDSDRSQFKLSCQALVILIKLYPPSY